MECLKGAVPSASRRVVRGGSWNNNTRNLRAANRNNNSRDNRNNNNGFRLSSPPYHQLMNPRMVSFTELISAVKVTMSAVPALRWSVQQIA